MHRATWTSLIGLICLVPFVQAGPSLRYEGQLTLKGTNFTGPGRFVFAIYRGLDPVWSSGPIPASGNHANLGEAMVLKVSDGVYAAQLGGGDSGATSIPEAALDSQAQLVVWFHDPDHGWRRIASEPLPARITPGPETGTATAQSAEMAQILQQLKDIHSDIHALNKANPGNARGGAPAQPAPLEPVSLPVNDSPALGSATAAVVLVEFTDYQCPFCKRFHETVMPQLMKDYVETGKLRIVSRNLPLPFHDQAALAAKAALCGGKQNKFWGMRQSLFARTASLSPSIVEEAATESGLDVAAFRACLTENSNIGDQVKRDGTQAAALGISGTPTFILGSVANGQITGVKIVGTRPYAEFQTEINKALAATEKKKS